jgi:Matrixin
MSALTPRRVASLALLAAVVVGVAACSPVTHRWDIEPVTFTFGPSMPVTGGYRDRVREGSTNWDGLGLPQRTFLASAPGTWTTDPCENLIRNLHNGVHLRGIDGPGGTLALTAPCVWTDRPAMANVDIVFDSAEAWWVSDSSAIPAGASDFESVATHELGHAWGWLGDHLSGPTLCGDSGPRHTMCAFHWPGTTDQRTPEQGDRDPIVAAYAP